MLTLTKKTEYGLIALTYLMRHEHKVCSAREISDACHIPLPLLMNILKLLAQNDIVCSLRGAQGGYHLGRPGTEISMALVVKTLEGPIKFVQCVGQSSKTPPADGRCERTAICSLRSPLLRIHREFEQLLQRITIAQLASDELTLLDPRNISKS